MLRNFLECLLCASEKAAMIARSCRSESSLFELLVEEKTGADKNDKFVQDFKTLADVLIQETVRHDLSQTFPVLGKHIFGEESNKFTNTLGETIIVSVQDDETKTKKLLEKVLDGNQDAASILAKNVHASINLVDIETTIPKDIPDNNFDIEDIGVWIDPIDATSQYIKGGLETVSEGHPPTKGLKVVTVLIGAFQLSSGQPCVGVVNQPFGIKERVHWGISLDNLNLSSVSSSSSQSMRALIGSSEDEKLVAVLSEKYQVIKAGGAGHKLLMIALGLADIYINSGGSTYKWDTCAPHSIIAAVGGRVVEFKQFLDGETDTDGEQCKDICYNVHEGGDKANGHGIIACREPDQLKTVKKLLQKL